MKPGISVVIPCLNEAVTIERAVTQAMAGIRLCDVQGEVIVADNGSTDGSRTLAQKAGATVVQVSDKGYGFALRAGFAAASYDWVAMADADLSYPFLELPKFWQERFNAHFVLGNRLNGPKITGAMPWLNRYFGTPLISFMIRKLFGMPVYDCNGGMRLIRAQTLKRLRLSSGGMELASEMLVRAARLRVPYKEVNISFLPDQRGRPPHLRRFRDGFRHLKLILSMVPNGEGITALDIHGN